MYSLLKPIWPLFISISECNLITDYFAHPSWRIVWICKISQRNDLYPAILWYFRYPKQERSKFFNQDFFCNRDFKIPHFSLLFLLHSDITAWSFQRNFYYFPCQHWQDVLRELKLLEIIFDIYCHQLVKKFLEKVAPLSL